MKCSDCGNEFASRYVYIDANGKCVCKYCYDGNYETNDNGEFIEKSFDLN